MSEIWPQGCCGVTTHLGLAAAQRAHVILQTVVTIGKGCNNWGWTM